MKMKKMNIDVKPKVEQLMQLKNRITGEIVFSSNLYEPKIIDGIEFLKVFSNPNSKNDRRTNWMRKDALDLMLSI